jgi:hypothetical protein
MSFISYFLFDHFFFKEWPVSYDAKALGKQIKAFSSGA